MTWPLALAKAMTAPEALLDDANAPFVDAVQSVVLADPVTHRTPSA
jgi:hypothetical protein